MPGAIVYPLAQNNKGEPMDTGTITTAQAAPLGVCVLCGRRILTSFYRLPAVRGQGYEVRTHTGCYDTEHGGLVGDELTAARAAETARLASIERRFGGQVAA